MHTIPNQLKMSPKNKNNYHENRKHSLNLDQPLVVKKKNNYWYEWNSNPYPKKPQTYTGFKVAAVLQRSTGVRPLCPTALLDKNSYNI